ncbi:MAG: hypothetical protein MZV65_17545 [Chromatiales bacterium]|nr:hypothetical protein [Chromatiales bacterium]
MPRRTLPPHRRDRRRRRSAIARWSLRLRYWASRVAAGTIPCPTPDVQVFALYHPPDGRRAVPDSLGPQQGPDRDHAPVCRRRRRAAATRWCWRTSCCTRSAPRTSTIARPGSRWTRRASAIRTSRRAIRSSFGEIMAGRIATSARERGDSRRASTQMLVGPATAREIGWAQ